MSFAANAGLKEQVKKDIEEIEESLDCMSALMGVDSKECLGIAYNEIKDRKGKLVNGVFVKEDDINEIESRKQMVEWVDKKLDSYKRLQQASGSTKVNVRLQTDESMLKNIKRQILRE